jgi:phytoene synthase
MNPTLKQIYKNGSRTYYNSSIFFPRAVKEDVFILYAFLRIADDLVDQTPPDATGFYRFRTAYETALKSGQPSGDLVIDGFIELAGRKNFDPRWAKAFLDSMELDLKKATYTTLDETLQYTYGSAEVIGLFMSRIIGLPEAVFPNARMLGRAMQYINFIRDIAEDLQMGRSYLPLENSGLLSLDFEYTNIHRPEFESFIRSQLALYYEWHREAGPFFAKLKRGFRIPIQTATDMYLWTARQIERDPFIVYQKKVKPGRLQIFGAVVRNALGFRRTSINPN